MQAVRYKDYFKQTDPNFKRLDSDAIIKVLKEKVVNGYKICLVVKETSLGIDLFYKNGNYNTFIECNDIDYALTLYDNGLIEKYRND